jgi:hypothetical protein
LLVREGTQKKVSRKGRLGNPETKKSMITGENFTGETCHVYYTVEIKTD